jgi:hypothetical protein
MLGMLAGGGLDGIEHTGDASVLVTLLGLLKPWTTNSPW